ncbi:MAG TPA: hypothetical protein VMV97_03145 [Sulfuriferula sp.]|nr:hypothetical protein [Sulfuriferula sp.]
MKTAIALLFSALALGPGLSGAMAAESQSEHGHGTVRDKRVVLTLTPEERAMILEEMRGFLSGVQVMTGALGKKDMQATADAARGMGQKMVHEVPPALRAKLPPEFRQLGFSVHSEFDQIAMDAESMKDVSFSLGQLSATLQKCVACHSVYQIQVRSDMENHEIKR